MANVSNLPANLIVSDYAFIDSYKRRPILWDSRLEDYKNTERKNAVWVELSEKVGMTSGMIK